MTDDFDILDGCCEDVKPEICDNNTEIIKRLDSIIALLLQQNGPPSNPEQYRQWLNDMKELKIIRDRYYPNYLTDWSDSLSLTPSTLAGRASTSIAGPPEQITLGVGLVMAGSVLVATAASTFVIYSSGTVVTTNVNQEILNTFWPDYLIGTVRNDDVANSVDLTIVWTNIFGDTGTDIQTIAPLGLFTFNPFTSMLTMGPPPYNVLNTGFTPFTFNIKSTLAGFPASVRYGFTRIDY